MLSPDTVGNPVVRQQPEEMKSYDDMLNANLLIIK